MSVNPVPPPHDPVHERPTLDLIDPPTQGRIAVVRGVNGPPGLDLYVVWHAVHTYAHRVLGAPLAEQKASVASIVADMHDRIHRADVEPISDVEVKRQIHKHGAPPLYLLDDDLRFVVRCQNEHVLVTCYYPTAEQLHDALRYANLHVRTEAGRIAGWIIDHDEHELTIRHDGGTVCVDVNDITQGTIQVHKDDGVVSHEVRSWIKRCSA